MDKFPDIALSYDERISTKTFEEFESIIDKTGFSYAKEPREHGPFAGVEWLLPTAVILFIGKAYFDSFFKEMGKDHYHLIKKGLRSFRKSFLSKTKVIQYKRVAVPTSKIPEDPICSVLFSIMAKTKNGQSIKFLFPECVSEEDFQESIEAFFCLLKENYSSEDVNKLNTLIQSLGRPQHTILIRYNQESRKAEVIDPMAEIRKQKQHNDKEISID
jgi:hypothetical protein